MKKLFSLALILLVTGALANAANIPFIDTKSVKPVTTSSPSKGESTRTPQSTSVQSDAKMAIMPPYYGDGNKTYIFNETGAKALLAQKSNLLKANCNVAQVLQGLGLGANAKVTSVSIGETNYDYTFDFRSCSLWGNKRNSVWTNTSLTEVQAIEKAKAFIKASGLSKKVYAQYGAPIVLYKNGNNPRPYMMKDAEGNEQSAQEDLSLSGIEIDPTDTGDIDVVPEYTSFSILFPYTLNGTPIYNAYGQRAGIQIEVTADGVTSINAQLLPFKGAVRNAEKLSGDDLVSFVKKGGNNPFRGQESEVNVTKQNKVFVLFSLWRNNVTELYLSSGIALVSNQKVDKYQTQNYEMIISDYKIGNSNFGW